MENQEPNIRPRPVLVPADGPEPDAVELAASRGDLGSVLATLNERTRHRFTGLFLFEPPMLRNIRLFDRENPLIDGSGGVSILDDTYCALVGAASAAFWTIDARTDERLEEPRVRGRVVSYAGVPVAHGPRRGTLCHYDWRPRLMSAREIAYLERVALFIAPFLATAKAD